MTEMIDSMMFFLLGISTFALGLASGWSMRGKVKEEELIRYKSLLENFDKLKWRIIDLLEQVKK
ncbi:hypothetical protein [Cytobacillus horneckiae]|uniref:hypothetical protein n=1 Tax=Cytobacillus horneckiae TaxID=549687 RepID=UPI00203B0287|nr:hypothetical protein [Cytobacillus horneckiae]MCM3180227.1 hypothetical protein [Cytobacillus horneckiae]